MSPLFRLTSLLTLAGAMACARNDAKPAAPAAPGAPAAAATIATTTFAPSLAVDLTSMTKTASGLYYRDLVVGTGAVVEAGQQVSVHYVGALPDGIPFDSNQGSDPPYGFVPGRSAVIQGWHEGVVGMRVGGKRQLILPPELGYGSAGNGPIPGDAILVFTIDVVSVP